MREEAKVFEEVIDTIQSQDVKQLAYELINSAPPYFFVVPSSSTQKYHPQYALGEGGLARHSCAVVRILNHILAVDCFGSKFTDREKDLMRVAALVHDFRKSGDQNSYIVNKYTKFDHPLQAAAAVRLFKGVLLEEDEIELIASMIESHMGSWNTDKKSSVVLPLPETKYQKLIHLADYLASRKDLEVLFDGVARVEKPVSAPKKSKAVPENPLEYKLTFGKHNGKTIDQVIDEDPGYVRWAKENINKEPLKSLLARLNV